MDASLIPKPAGKQMDEVDKATNETYETSGVIQSNEFSLFYGKTAGIKNITLKFEDFTDGF